MSKSSKRKGSRPISGQRTEPDKNVLEEIRKSKDDFPLLSTRFLQKGWDFSTLDDDMRKEFLDKWHQRSMIKWRDLTQHNKHGLGSEYIPKRAIKPQIPNLFQELDKFRVYRHKGNLPFAGWKDGAVFYVIWIEKKYGELYEH